MESPVIIENCANFATPAQTGFPFDDSAYESHDHFEARLNDLAQRHPELADHLKFPSLRRKRYGSGSSQDQDESRSQANNPGTSNTQFNPDSRRFGDHSFPSGFNRFPFSRHFEDFEPRRDDKPPEVPKSQEKRGRKPNPYLPQHLSNTVDLGQKQTPVEEKRSQRSMSAPPENRSAQNVTSSRVHAEPFNAQQSPEPDMGKSFSRQSQPQPRERIIPIHVEGRDDPVIPKSAHGATPEKVFGGERGHHPSYQQYSHPRQQQQSQFPKHGFFEPFAENVPTTKAYQQGPFTKQTTPPSQQAPARDPSPAPGGATFQQHHEQQHQDQGPPQPHHATPPPMNDPLEKIKCVRNDVMDLMHQVEKFTGTKKDRYYLYLDEMLTRNLIKLDDIETEGKENIRLARKEAIKCIQTCINKLEANAKEMGRKTAELALQNMETEAEISTDASDIESEKVQTEQEQKTETEVVANKPVFKSEATLVISSAPKIGDDGDKPDTDTAVIVALPPMEVEPSSSDTAAPVEQKSSMETAQLAAAPAETSQPQDVAMGSAKEESSVDSTSTEIRPEETASSQSSETPVSQK